MSATILEFPKPNGTSKAKATPPEAKPDDRYVKLARVSHTAMCDLNDLRKLFPEGAAEHIAIDIAHRVLVPLFILAHRRERGAP